MTDKPQDDIEALQAQLQALISTTADDAATRKKLFNVTMGAAAQLESPLDVCWRTMMYKQSAPQLQGFEANYIGPHTLQAPS